MTLASLLDPAVHLAHLAVTGLASHLPAPDPGVRIALALVLVTWAVRAALLPLAVSATRARRSSAAVADEVARLRQRHAADPARLGRELRRVYRDAGVNPFAGLLPMVVQLPVVSILYRLVVVPVVAGQPNLVLNAVVLGVPLGSHWPALIATAGSPAGPAVALAGLLLALTAVAWASSRQIARASSDAALSGVGRLLRALPYATVGFAVIMPAAVGLYLLASTTWSVAERALLPS